jgi:GNAT superfamily N-acetyltransferase
MEWQNNNFSISTDKNKLQIERIHRFLSREAYWSMDIPVSVIEKGIANSICYGVYDNKTGQQIGFARIVTDTATFAWFSDVYIEKEFRGQGLSVWLVECMMENPDIQNLRRVCLATRDAHKLYEKFGFELTKTPTYWMEIKDNELYQRLKKS